LEVVLFPKATILSVIDKSATTYFRLQSLFPKGLTDQKRDEKRGQWDEIFLFDMVLKQLFNNHSYN
jgi:hypothetical protein